MPDTPILTKEDYKTVVGIQASDTSKDARIDLLIPWIQTLIRNYSGRDFGAEGVAEERPFLYDGSGYLDIDDASEITQVKVGETILAADRWIAQPFNESAVWWLELPPRRGHSSEMGFTANWDVLGAPLDDRVYVTADWGWPIIPGDVKMAAVWTLAAWLSNPLPFVSESIEGYSRTVSLPRALEDAVPARAKSVLEAYDRGPSL